MTIGDPVSPIGSFTDPEYAQVGLTETKSRERYDVETAVLRFDSTTRTIIDGHKVGFCKLIVDHKTHRILGCHVVGERAVEITQIELAQAFNIANCTLYDWINRYPDLHEAIQVGVDVFNPRVERALAERAIGFFVTLREEVKDPETGKVIAPAKRQYYPPDPTSIIFFLKNRLRDKYKDVHKVENDLHLKTSEECRIQIRKDILELQAQGYDPKIIDDDDAPALTAPKRGNGSGNGAG